MGGGGVKALYTDTDTVLAQYHVKDPGHSAKSAGGRLQSKRITLLLTERGVAGGGGGGVKALYNDRNGETGLDCGADETEIKFEGFFFLHERWRGGEGGGGGGGRTRITGRHGLH